MSGKTKVSELIAIATEVDKELERFEESTAGFRKTGLNSERNLERARKALEELADGEQRVIEKVQELVKHLGTVRDRQLAQVELIRARADELKARVLVFHSLEEELKALGHSAATISEKLKGASDLGDLDGEIGELSDKAKALAERASTEDFDDLARVADGLRQQILAVRQKLKKVPKPTASA
jgi:predicted  nucleic acid-binding Zn-ribbon protein